MEEQEGLCGEGGERKRKEEEEKKEVRLVPLNPVLGKVHTRGWNANESWHLKATRQKGQNFLN